MLRHCDLSARSWPHAMTPISVSCVRLQKDYSFTDRNSDDHCSITLSSSFSLHTLSSIAAVLIHVPYKECVKRLAFFREYNSAHFERRFDDFLRFICGDATHPIFVPSSRAILRRAV